jgi:hypothetical protein
MLALSLGLACSALASPLVDPNQVAQFPTARAAQRHCPMDKVLWLDTLTRRYYYSNSKRYGKTVQGAYVCKRELKGIGKRTGNSGE